MSHLKAHSAENIDASTKHKIPDGTLVRQRCWYIYPPERPKLHPSQGNCIYEHYDATVAELYRPWGQRNTLKMQPFRQRADQHG